MIEDADQEDEYPADPGVGAGANVIGAYRNLTPKTLPPAEDLGGGNRMLHVPADYFDEQIQTREGFDPDSNATEFLARVRDLMPLINPTE